MRRAIAFVRGLVPAMLGGAFFLLTFSSVVDPNGDAGAAFLVGGFCGAAVVGLIRLFRIAPWGYGVAGLICGPIPFLVLFQEHETNGEDRFGVWLVGALFGLLIGLLEWARVHRAESSRGS